MAIEGGPARYADCDWKRTLELMDRNIAGGLAFDRYGGTEVDAYEREFAAFTASAAATAVSSGTAAIHSALAALHLEPGSEVICPPITDPGSIGPVRRTFGRSQLPWSLPGYARVLDYAGYCPSAEAAVAGCMLLSLTESCDDDTVDAVAEAFIKVTAAYSA